MPCFILCMLLVSHHDNADVLYVLLMLVLCLLTAGITSCWHTNKARFYAGTHHKFASFAGKKQVEKAKNKVSFSKNIVRLKLGQHVHNL